MLSVLIRKMMRLYFTRRAMKNIKAFKEKPVINGKTEFNNKTEIGENNHFNGLVISGNGKVIIGDNFHSGAKCRIITSFHNYEGEALPYDRVNIDKDVVIGDNVWLGYGVLILGGVTIEDGAIIQAGSVVVSDIPKNGISGGSPAKVFKYRDKVHYEKLVKEKRYHKKSYYEKS
jgi:acetyltransferase-like isoleucine patch superfamily enzyme